MLGFAILYIILGAAIKYGKAYYLIAGYNTMSREEKAKYDIKGIATLFRNVLFFMAALHTAGWLLILWLDRPDLEDNVIIITSLPCLLYLIVKSNSKRYRIGNK